MGKTSDIFKAIGTFVKDRDTEILTITSIVGVVTTAAVAMKSGSKVDQIISETKQDLDDTAPNDKETKRAVIVECGKQLVPALAPTILVGGSTIACIVGNRRITNKKIAVLSAAYSLSEKTAKELGGKMEEVLGEKKARSIKDEIMKDNVGSISEDTNQVVLTGGDGCVWCKDLYSGRLFRSNVERIGRAVNKLSANIMQEMYISLNEFYDEIGLDRIPLGDDLGWNIDQTTDGRLPITYTAVLSEDGVPCLAIDSDISVRSDFRHLL